MYIILDQGTSSTKCFIFGEEGKILWSSRIKHKLYRPQPHNVECDADEIFNACYKLLDEAVEQIDQIGGIIISCGLAVQRSTFLFWDKMTGQALTPALSWQDSRSQKEVTDKSDQAELIHSITGTPLSAHFGAPKFLHMIRESEELQKHVKNGNIWYGPLSAYLCHRLTGRAVVDVSIGGRSLLMNLDLIQWDKKICNIFNVPLSNLPPLVPTQFEFGSLNMRGQSILLNCIIGDQQAALIGQGGIKPGTIAMNFGTSGSIQLNTNNKPLHVKGLISSVLFSSKDKTTYMIEGTINASNALFYWLEDELKISHKEMNWHERCAATTTEGLLIPGFAGIAAPYWNPGFESVYINLGEASNDEIVRAGMESIGLLAFDIFEKMVQNIKLNVEYITASGGGSRPPLLQFIADMIQIPIGHAILKDRTALGVYKLLSGQGTTYDVVECDKIYHPEMPSGARLRKIADWHTALRKHAIK